MTYLVFNTEQECIDNEAIISSNMGFPRIGICAACGQPYPTHQKTEKWAEHMQRLDGKWVIPKSNGYMDNTSGYTEEEYSRDWFPDNVDMV